MVLITYQIILFFIISLSYYLTLNHYMAVTVGNFHFNIRHVRSHTLYVLLPTL